MRADQLLMARGLAPTRSAAQRLIQQGAAQWLSPKGWTSFAKAGEAIPDAAQLRVTDDAELRYVSRGGLKLEGALKTCAMACNGLVALDVGQSTGGFTDCLLKHGVRQVVGVDVGHGQLAQALIAHERVVTLEGLNARAMQAQDLEPHFPPGGFDLVVGDLSFISLRLVLPALTPLLSEMGSLLMLVKPQFELQPQDIGKGGIVKDAASYARVESSLRSICTDLKLDVQAYFASDIEGGDGNREFFIWARHTKHQGTLT